MEFEFDKEIDSLLRQSAKGDVLFPKQTANVEHIDADEISMFAENSLPEKARPQVINHLADCNRCRTVLSNVIALNAEDEKVATVPVANTKAETVVESTEPGWFQRLFTTKNLAFGMGALAVIFAVGIGFIVVQNISNGGGELAKQTSSENTTTAEAPMADSATAQDRAISPTDGADDSSSKLTDFDEGNAVVKEEVNERSSTSDSVSRDDSNVFEPSPIENKSERRREKRDSNDKKTLTDLKTGNSKDGESKRNDADQVSDGIVMSEEVFEEADDENKSAGEKNQPAKTKATSPVVTRKGRVSPKKPIDKRDKELGSSVSGVAPIKRTVGGKTFTRKNGVWTDTAYKNQRTTNVKRKTNQYRKLDSGLQSIGNQISGTVIVVWKSKAYKIQ